MWCDNFWHFWAKFWPEKITSRDGCFLPIFGQQVWLEQDLMAHLQKGNVRSSVWTDFQGSRQENDKKNTESREKKSWLCRPELSAPNSRIAIRYRILTAAEVSQGISAVAWLWPIFIAEKRPFASNCRQCAAKEGEAMGARSLFFCFGHLLVMILSPVFTFWSLFCLSPFTSPLCGRAIVHRREMVSWDLKQVRNVFRGEEKTLPPPQLGAGKGILKNLSPRALGEVREHFGVNSD